MFIINCISIDSRYRSVALDKGIKNLKELQSLDCVNISRSHPKVVEELGELHQLKRLGATDLKRAL